MKSRDPEKLKAYLERTAGIIEESVDDLLPPGDAYPESIHSVMRHSIFAGGKRIRPALLFAANEACGGEFGNRDAVVTASGLEMLHTFSLMHDDLPCMDNDDFRRGKPTAHKAFSEAIAVLGGDALCIFAFEVLSETDRVDIIKVISRALGTRGMIAGQVVDVESENVEVDKERVDYIHMNKTAALIKASILSGAMLANASEQEIEILSEYGSSIGLAFQIVDDVLDETSSTEELGKDIGSDAEGGKATYPAVMGLEESKRAAKECTLKAVKEIEKLGDRAEILEELAYYLQSRVN